MKYIKNILVMIVFISLQSCETDVDASDLINQQQLVVINGYLSPQDETLKVQVSKSVSITSGSSGIVIEDATVVLSDDENNEVTLTYSSTLQSYETAATNLPIIAGEQYFLSVNVDGKEYTSSCRIPARKVENIEQSISDASASGDFFGNRSLKVTIEDIKDISNYYIIGASLTDGPNVNFEFEQFVTDTNRENTTVSANGGLFLNDSSTDNVLKVQVSNSEKILYDALRATFLNDYNEGNPFVESIIPPSNIAGENGFGVFAGYQLTEMEFNL